MTSKRPLRSSNTETPGTTDMSDHPEATNDGITLDRSASRFDHETLSASGETPGVRPSTTLDSAPPGFRLERELGRGGMGIVYLAHQLGLNRPVALKLMLADDSKAIIRFLAESELVASVRHPNVVETYQFGEHEGRPFLALEFLSGGSLADYLKERPAPAPEHFPIIAETTARIADGVQAAHAMGIVHRDLKPHNVLFAETPSPDQTPTPKVVDFGLAKRGLGGELTRTSTVMGTPAYMPPEQAKGEAKFVGPEADVWSLGVILYELLTGGRPFEGNDTWQTLAAVIRGDFPKPKRANPAVPRDLELICLKCLQANAADRYPTAGALAEDLRRWIAGKPISARPAGWIETATKSIRRNKTIAAAAAISALALIAGTIVSLRQAVRADAEAENAKQAAGLAERKTTEAEVAAEKFRIAGIAAHDQLIRGHLSTTRIYLDRNDFTTSLHWIAKAWLDDKAALEPGSRLDPQREANHRLRFGDALEKFAKPVVFCQHDCGVHEAELSEDGRLLVTLAEDGQVRVWRTESGELAYQPLNPTVKAVSFALSPNGELLVIAVDRAVRIHRTATGETLREVKFEAPVLRVAFAPDGRRFAAAAGNLVRCLDTEGTETEPTIDVGEAVDYVTFSPDGGRLVTTGPGERAFVWDATNGERLSKALPHTRPKMPPGGDADHPTFLSRKHPVFDSGGKRLLTTDGTNCWLWTDQERLAKPFKLSAVPTALIEARFVGDKGMPAAVVRSGSTKNTLFRFDPDRSITTADPVGYPRQTAGLRLSSDGRLSAVPISAGRLFVRTLDGGKDVCEPIVCTKPVTAFRFVDPGNRLLVASLDGTVRLFELPGERPEESKYDFDCGRADLLVIPGRMHSPDGKTIALVANGKVELRERLGDRPKATLEQDGVGRAIFSPTGETLATASRTDVKLWRVADGVLLHTFPFGALRQSSNAVSVNWAWSLDGKRLALVETRGPLHVFDLPSATTKLKVVVPQEYAWNLSLSGTGEFVAVSGFIDRVSRWNVDSGVMLPEVNLAKDALMVDLRFGADGRLLTIASDLTVRQWKADGTGPAGPTIRLASSPHEAAYSPDQRRIAVMYAKLVQVFDASSGEMLATRSFAETKGNLKVWWSTDGMRVIVHDAFTPYVRTWRLGTSTVETKQVPDLASLMTGSRFDSVEGITPIDVDDFSRRSAAYRDVWRSTFAPKR